jgi:hypothetical protein
MSSFAFFLFFMFTDDGRQVELIRGLDDCPELVLNEEQNVTRLQLGDIKAEVNGPSFIQVTSSVGTIHVPTPQPDYGRIETLAPLSDRSFAAIGTQLSYVVKFNNYDEDLVQIIDLPHLFRTNCNFFRRLIGDCFFAQARYSDASNTLFISGYGSGGTFQSFRFQDVDGLVDISDSMFPIFLGDTNDNRSLFLDKKGNTAVISKNGRAQACIRN